MTIRGIPGAVAVGIALAGLAVATAAKAEAGAQPHPLQVALLGVGEAKKDDAPAAAGKPEAKPAGYKDAIAGVVRIADDVKRIEGRLASLEKSVASMDQSLQSVSGAIRPEGINVIVTRASEVAFERGKILVFLVTACLAALIVLHAALRHYLPARSRG